VATYHVYPLGDSYAHDTALDADCLCGPTIEAVEQDEGGMGWVIVHHSLDGRETRELGAVEHTEAV
jgi:hypothetical protein